MTFLVPLVIVSLLAGCSETERFTQLPAAPSPISSAASSVSTPTPTPPATRPPPTIPSPLPSLAGNYTLMTTANGCSQAFPAEFRRRTYRARIEQDNTKVRVILSGPTLDPGAATAGYDASYVQYLWVITPTGELTLTNYQGNDQWNFVADQASPSDLLTILVDEARLTVTRNGLSGNFTGAFLLYPNTLARLCQATNHPLDLSR